MAPDGSGAAMTASSPTRNALWADWTLDGSRIAYAYKFTDRSGNEASQLRVMAADLSDDREVGAERPGFRMTPEWAPAGDRVVFTLYEQGRSRGEADLFTVAADGTGLRRLTSLPGEELEPTFSSDGERVFFARRDASRPPAVTSVWSVRADGGDLREHVGGDALVALHDVAVAPLAARLAFTGGADGRMFVASLDGGGIDPVSPRVSLQPSWSPDGTTLALVRLGAGGDQTLWRVPVADPQTAAPLRGDFQRGYGIEGADWVSDRTEAHVVVLDERAPAVTLARLERRDGQVVRTAFGPSSSARRGGAFRVARRRDLAFVALDRSGVRRVEVLVGRARSGAAAARVVIRAAADWRRVRRKLGRGVHELRFRTADRAGNAALSRRIRVRVGAR
jgi:dipeptidyl aminopeptidase/acylaminoacyl peptidase